MLLFFYFFPFLLWFSPLFNTHFVVNCYLSSSTEKIDEENSFRWNLKCGETFYKPKFSTNKRIKRIIGGEDAVNHSWPFLATVRILLNGESEHHCGGTIISGRHILTAAHCIFVYIELANQLEMDLIEMMSLMKVNLGIFDHTKSDENEYSVVDFYIHEDFNYSDWTVSNDLMILILDRPIDFESKNVNLACLPSPSKIKSAKVGQNVVGIGWGSYVDGYNHEFHDNVQQAFFKILDSEDSNCNSGMVGNVTWDKENLLCASGRKKVTCFGDSGGPVLELRNDLQWTLVGVISFGNDIYDYSSKLRKCNPSMPFYFVNVEKYYDWIMSIIEEY